MASVGDVMTSEIVTVGEHDTLGTVARTLRHHNIGSAIVVNEGGEPVGIITERDLVESVAASRNPDQGTAESWMTRELVTIERDAELSRARELMTEHTIRHLAVVENGKVVGVLSIRDVLN
jgi:CBS domain-containing protein